MECGRIFRQALLASFTVFCSFSSVLKASTDGKIHLNGVTLTPGGFLAGEGLWRSRNEESDIASTFSGIPMMISPLAHMREFRLSARQTRLSLLVQGEYEPTVLSGYVEIDFLGTGTANSNESNSYNPRMRNVYATVDMNDTGWHVLAGQNWSLATLNSKGITPRNETLPPTIDAQYVVGFVWKRQPQFRVTKDFCKKVWAAISIENPQTTFSGVPSGPFGNVYAITDFAPGMQSLPSTTNYSLNSIPDVIAKLALESTLFERKLHTEVFGIARDFYDRVRYSDNSNENQHNSAGGVGAGLAIELYPKCLDFQASVLIGKGIGSYATGLLPDATINSEGALVGIPEIVYMMGATLHASQALDIYVFGGVEKEQSKYFQIGNVFYGYGIPTADNASCNSENAAAAGCSGATRELWQLTAGFWDKICQGNAGELRVGLQYSYTRKELFSGTNNGTTPPVDASTDDNMIFAALRYYPFNVPA